MVEKTKKSKRYFFKGYVIGAAFCGAVAILLLIVLWIFM